MPITSFNLTFCLIQEHQYVMAIREGEWFSLNQTDSRTRGISEVWYQWESPYREKLHVILLITQFSRTQPSIWTGFEIPSINGDDFNYLEIICGNCSIISFAQVLSNKYLSLDITTQKHILLIVEQGNSVSVKL